MAISNRKLYESYSNLIETSLNVTKLGDDQFPKREVRKIVENENGTLSIKSVLIDNYYEFVEKYRREILALQEYNKFEQLIENETTIKRHFNRHVGYFLNTTSYSAIDFIMFALAKIQEFSVDGQRPRMTMNKMYRDLEKFIYHDEIPVHDIIPLDNFDSDILLLRLGKGVILRRITIEEKELLLKLKIINDFRVMSLKHVIEFKYSTRKIWWPNHDISDKVVDSLMPSLMNDFRLYKNGLIGYSVIIGKIDMLLPIGNWHTTRQHRELKEAILPDARPNSPVEQFNEKLYVLWKNDIPQFNSFRKYLHSISHKELGRFNLALRRFNFSYGREFDEDKIIDYAISIEALFSVENDSFDSISYRLALRFSRLLANRFGDRQNVFKDIRTFYNTRSKIVHGSAKNRQKYLDKINIPKIESYLRSALKTYVMSLSKRNLDHQKLMDNLDFGK